MSKALETLEKVITDQQGIIAMLIKINMESKNESISLLGRFTETIGQFWGQMLAEQLKEKQKEGKPTIDDNTGHVDFPRSGPT